MKSWDRVSQLYHYRQAGPDSFWLRLIALHNVGFRTALYSQTLVTTPHDPTAPSCNNQKCLRVAALITWGSTPLPWWESLEGVTKGRVIFVLIRASSFFVTVCAWMRAAGLPSGQRGLRRCPLRGPRIGLKLEIHRARFPYLSHLGHIWHAWSCGRPPTLREMTERSEGTCHN